MNKLLTHGVWSFFTWNFLVWFVCCDCAHLSLFFHRGETVGRCWWDCCFWCFPSFLPVTCSLGLDLSWLKGFSTCRGECVSDYWQLITNCTALHLMFVCFKKQWYLFVEMVCLGLINYLWRNVIFNNNNNYYYCYYDDYYYLLSII